MKHPIRSTLHFALAGLSALALVACSQSDSTPGAPKRPECVAPAKPGGGFDLTCKLAQTGLKDTGLLTEPMRVTYLPGGVGWYRAHVSLATLGLGATGRRVRLVFHGVQRGARVWVNCWSTPCCWW